MKPLAVSISQDVESGAIICLVNPELYSTKPCHVITSIVCPHNISLRVLFKLIFLFSVYDHGSFEENNSNHLTCMVEEKQPN